MEHFNMLYNEEDVIPYIEALINAIDVDSSSSSGDSSDLDERDEEDPVDFVEVLKKYTLLEFRAHMRITPSTARYLIDGFSSSQFIPNLCHGGKQGIDGEKSIFMYIWYISNTITFRQLGVLFNVTKSTAWLVVNRVTYWLISIGHDHVKWPQGAEINIIQAKFQSKRGIPGIIGAIDCTHISIKTPKNFPDNYNDRHKNKSVILQAVVDHEKKFIDISCGEPGSLHDHRVLRRSNLYRRAQENIEQLFPNNTFILGDSAYPPTRWIVPPYKDYGNLTEAQRKFNYIHSSTRIVVENGFALLKTRFRRLLHFTEHTNLPGITNLIVSICVVHNICIKFDDLNDFVDNENYNYQHEEDSDDMMEFLEERDRRDILFNYLITENII